MKPFSHEQAEDLILAFIEEELTGEDKEAFLAHLEGCSQCRETVHDLKLIRGTLTDAGEELFCPEVWELETYAQTGEDPHGLIAAHIDKCPACREEVSEARTAPRLEDVKIPPTTKAAVRSSLGKGIESPSLFSSLRERLSRLATVPVLTLGTAAAAAILVVVLIQSGGYRTPSPGLGSSERHEEEKADLATPKKSVADKARLLREGKMERGVVIQQEMVLRKRKAPMALETRPAPAPAEALPHALGTTARELPQRFKSGARMRPQQDASPAGSGGYAYREEPHPRIPAVIIFKGFHRPLSRERVDEFYRALAPRKGLPCLVEIRGTKQALPDKDSEHFNRKGVLSGLRRKPGVDRAILLTVIKNKEEFAVNGELVETATGKIVKKSVRRGLKRDQVPRALAESVRVLCSVRR